MSYQSLYYNIKIYFCIFCSIFIILKYKTSPLLCGWLIIHLAPFLLKYLPVNYPKSIFRCPENFPHTFFTISLEIFGFFYNSLIFLTYFPPIL